MYITLNGYTKSSDLKKNFLDCSGQFMTKLPANQNPKPISQKNVFTNSPAVKLSISKEGLDGWREIVREQQAENAGQDDEEDILLGACMISYSTLLYGERTVSFGDSGVTLNDEAVDLVHAYGKLYDEIVQGYENGQREAYVVDPNAKDGMRRLTLDEELAYLNEAFQHQADGLVTQHTYLQKMWNMKIDFKGMEIRHATGAEREALLREKEEYEYRMQNKALENMLPENTKEKLTSAVQEFISQYLSGNGRNVSQILANIKSLSEFRK